MATRFDYRNLAGHCKEENCSEGGKSYKPLLRRSFNCSFCRITGNSHLTVAALTLIMDRWHGGHRS